MRKKLSPEEIAERLRKLEGWRHDAEAGTLQCELRFADFREAFAFMTEVALHAERLDHHPDWSNVYRNVQIRLSTHDAGGVTELDFMLAHGIDQARARYALPKRAH
jgi:4a-hydroxytetrahydrobiopterin dehydratase